MSERDQFLRMINKPDVTIPQYIPRQSVIPRDMIQRQGRMAENAVSSTVPTEREVRGYTSPVEVTSTSKILLPADPKRKFLFIQNNDLLGSVTLSFGSTAVLGIGIKLASNGGGILLDINTPTADLYAIGSIASNSNVTLISG